MHRSIISVHSEDCYGCTACASVCTLNAIGMQSNDKGFLRPVLDQSKCVNCGKCLIACPALQKEAPTSKTVECYAGRIKDSEIRAKSTSGGAFSAFASALTVSGAIVYGAEFNRSGVRHIRVENGDISSLRGSKYVQSDLSDSFSCISRDLKAGKTVLFVGTPCQCGGLRKFAKASRLPDENLYIIDFICHGTSSSRIFSDYLTYCEKKHSKKIVDHIFRSKANGWHAHLEANVFEDGEVDSASFDSQIHKGIFYSAYAFSDRCYKCDYASKERVSDITIADFWGIERALPEFDDNKGTSFVIISTSKGKTLFDMASDSMECVPVDISDTRQPHLDHSVARPENTDAFWDTYFKKGFSKIAVKYFAAGKLRRFASKIYHKIRGK